MTAATLVDRCFLTALEWGESRIGNTATLVDRCFITALQRGDGPISNARPIPLIVL